MKLICGDNRQTLKTLPDKSVQCIVTSPPYYGLRDYGTAAWEGGDVECDHNPQKPDGGDRENRTLPLGRGGMFKGVCGRCGAIRVDSQIGLESTPELYVAELVAVFRECKRVLKDDGTLWLNLGDSYARQAGDDSTKKTDSGMKTGRTGKSAQLFKSGNNVPPVGLKPKDLIGIPWMVAFALRADGWYLRSDIIWHKPNPMPESVTDRPTKSHEYIFLLSKSAQYFYDSNAIAEPCAESTPARMLRGVSDNHKNINGAPGQTPHSMNKPRRKVDSWEERKAAGAGSGSLENGHNASIAKGAGFSHTLGDGMTRNKRDVWTVNSKPFKEAHFATFPPDLIEPCILAGTSERGECPNCGKAWVRIIERTGVSNSENEVIKGTLSVETSNQTSGRVRSLSGSTYKPVLMATDKWSAQCDCNAEPVPQIVLDPFNGAGTSAVVSIKNGRDYIGIDLNPEYIELTKKRLEKVQLVIRQESFGG